MSNERVMVSTYGQLARWLSLADALVEITEAMRTESSTIFPYANGLMLDRGLNGHHGFSSTGRERALLATMARLMSTSSASEGKRCIDNIFGVYSSSSTPRITNGAWHGLSTGVFDENTEALLLAIMAGQHMLPEDVRVLGASTVNLAAVSQLRKQFEDGDHLGFDEALEMLRGLQDA